MDEPVGRNRVRLRFDSPTTKVKDIIRVPCKKSVLLEHSGLRLTLRSKQSSMQTIDEYEEDLFEGEVDESEDSKHVMAWLTDDVFVYNPPVLLNEKSVEILLDTFLKLGFKKLRCASIQPQT